MKPSEAVVVGAYGVLVAVIVWALLTLSILRFG